MFTAESIFFTGIHGSTNMTDAPIDNTAITVAYRRGPSWSTSNTVFPGPICCSSKERCILEACCSSSPNVVNDPPRRPGSQSAVSCGLSRACRIASSTQFNVAPGNMANSQ